MRLTPSQVAFRMYIGMGVPFENGPGEDLRKLGIEWLNSHLKTDRWPKDEFELYDFLVLGNPGGFTYQNGHLDIKKWLDAISTRSSRRYIIVEFGAPQVSKDLPVFRPNRLAVMARTWEHVHVFDSTSHYTASPREAPSLGLISRILAHTFYNPQMNLEFTWSRQSGYNQEDLVALVEAGLEQDDDLIQQWFGGDEVLKLLRAAKTWEDTQIAVDAICGAHEVEPHVRHYVDEVLGKAGT